MEDAGFMEVNMCEDSSEIDFDYEYDAVKYFDFTRPETVLEVDEAESWFQSAPTYPPSPLVAKFWRISESENGETSSANSRDHHGTYSSSNRVQVGCTSEASTMDEDNRSCMMSKSIAKSPLKSFLSRSSRLLKPTASHLAKQTQPRGVRLTSSPGRNQKPGSPLKTPGETEATKRQKLEIGFLRKVAHLKHQVLFSHNLNKKVGPVDVKSSPSRAKVTVPKEPDLKTAQRAQKRRFKNMTHPGRDRKSNISAFKARPLNRKIPGSPSLPHPKKSTSQSPEFQLFHTRTLERAIQQSSDNGSSAENANATAQHGMVDPKRTDLTDSIKQEKSNLPYRFKARPLNKKIFTSKGEMGIFRSSKRETTTVKEFKLSSSRRVSQSPPIELFNKLSLASENHSVEVNKDEQPCLTKMTNSLTGKATGCFVKQNSIGGGTIRSLRIH